MKFIHTLTVLPFLVLFCNPASAQEQPTNQPVNECFAQAQAAPNSQDQIIALGRAENLARQAAEAANGGIGRYRAADSMHGPVSAAPCTISGDGRWTFTFQGTTPGSNVPIAETAVTVNSQTWQVTVDRNTRLQ